MSAQNRLSALTPNCGFLQTRTQTTALVIFFCNARMLFQRKTDQNQQDYQLLQLLHSSQEHPRSALAHLRGHTVNQIRKTILLKNSPTLFSQQLPVHLTQTLYITLQQQQCQIFNYSFRNTKRIQRKPNSKHTRRTYCTALPG